MRAKRKFKTKLPDKPSKLILIALEDLEKVEGDSRYVIDMGNWHITPMAGDKCHVCFAGSVMAMRDGLKEWEMAIPHSFLRQDERKLTALNAFRIGMVGNGLASMGIDSSRFFDVATAKDWIDATLGEERLLDYWGNGKQTRGCWKLHMQDLAGILAAEGL